MKNIFSALAFLWPMLSLVCLALIVYGLGIALRKLGWPANRRRNILVGTSALILVWAGLLGFLAYKGFFGNFQLPPRPVLALLAPLPVILVFAFSSAGSKILKLLPPHWLVLIQSFRIIVELLLWFAFLVNQLPVQMTFEGGNLDIFTGLLALPAAYLLAKKKSGSINTAIAFNILGILLLLNILIIAILSMPTPIRYFMNEPSNALVAQFPYILLPGILVPVAYGSHILSLRQIYLLRRNSPASDRNENNRLIFEGNLRDGEEKNIGNIRQHKGQLNKPQIDSGHY